MKKRLLTFISIFLIAVCVNSCYKSNMDFMFEANDYIKSVEEVPEFSNKPYVVINDNIPFFDEKDMKPMSFESYSSLDALGRNGVAFACIGLDLMPTEERGSIGQIKPAGWHTVKYDCVDGKYLYNRCHLIGYQLSGENSNERNLMTGTRYLNMEGMLPFENLVAEYVEETGNHVLYRVTPIYKGDNLLSHGVQIEAKSVEDEGEGICFNIYAYNAQPKIAINYENGDSKIDDGKPFPKNDNTQTIIKSTYILNIKSMKFHKSDCKSVNKIKDENKKTMLCEREYLIEQGYSPCQQCNP